ncbi:MAG: hypothetical protein H0U89_07015 [Acidimicrobiia bacterium]|nr:hypothetical protein [Acidimicrobiia bacterium]
MTARFLPVVSRALALLLAVAVLGACQEPERPGPPPPPVVGGTGATSVDRVADGFPARRDRFVDGLVAKQSSWWDLDAQKGVVLLARAARTGDRSRVAEANTLLNRGIDRIDDGVVDGQLIHGGAFTFVRAALLFGPRPDLLLPATRDRLLTGRKADGSVRRGESLLKFRDELFARNTALGFDIADPAYNPWRVFNNGQTENHRLQVIVTGMLLSEVYGSETVGGRRVRDTTAATDDYWHYFRDAFLRFNGPWGVGRAINSDHFGTDVAGEEQDSFGYFHTHLGDYWMVRDLYSDPAIRDHAEILVDRMLIDYAEDSVRGLYTGYSGRVYQRNYVNGRTSWVLNHLLFDNLGYTPDVLGRDALANDSNWGSWLHLAVATGGYDPTNPRFPRAVIDLARNKGDGYLVTEGRYPHGNWVEEDFALGFLMDGTGSRDRHAGGFYVTGAARRGGGLNVAPFYGDQPLPSGQDKPVYESSTVLDRRVAITRNFSATRRMAGSDGRLWTGDDQFPSLPRGRLWISSERDSSGAAAYRFDAVEQQGRWLFVRERAELSGRDVYLAVAAATGGWQRLADVQDGMVYELTDSGAATVWETSTSQDHASFEAFRADVLDNELTSTLREVTYRSSRLDSTLALDVTGADAHRVDGTLVDWSAYRHGFHTPFSDNPHGSATARLERGGYEAVYDWDPDDDGDLDEAPSKRVDNVAG